MCKYQQITTVKDLFYLGWNVFYYECLLNVYYISISIIIVIVEFTEGHKILLSQ